MKNFKLLFSIAVASAFVGCSSMAIDDAEVMAVSLDLPADFNATEYMELHPELLRLQIKDYVKLRNSKVAKELITADTAAFSADTLTMHKIAVKYAGFTEEDWISTLLTTEKDSIIYATKIDTVALGVRSKADAAADDATRYTSVYVCSSDDITYTDAVISSVVAYTSRDSSCTSGKNRVCTYTCTGESKTYDVAEYEFNLKVSNVKLGGGLQTVETKDSIGTEKVPVPGKVNPTIVRVTKLYNFYETLADTLLLASFEPDL